MNVLRVTLSSLPVLIRVLRCGYEVNRLFHMKLFHHHHDHKGMWTEWSPISSYYNSQMTPLLCVWCHKGMMALWCMCSVHMYTYMPLVSEYVTIQHILACTRAHQMAVPGFHIVCIVCACAWLDVSDSAVVHSSYFTIPTSGNIWFVYLGYYFRQCYSDLHYWSYCTAVWSPVHPLSSLNFILMCVG